MRSQQTKYYDNNNKDKNICLTINNDSPTSQNIQTFLKNMWIFGTENFRVGSSYFSSDTILMKFDEIAIHDNKEYFYEWGSIFHQIHNYSNKVDNSKVQSQRDSI